VKAEDILKYYLNYYVVFESTSDSEEYSPVIFSSFSNREKVFYGLHGFDEDLENILPALWYCIQLPRNVLDTVDLPAQVMKKDYSVSHNIILISSSVDQEPLSKKLIKLFPPTLVIGEDTCSDFSASFASGNNATLGAITVGDISSEILRDHWNKLTNHMQSVAKRDSPLHVRPRLLLGNERKALPLTFTTNQFKTTPSLLDTLQADRYLDKSILKHSFIEKNKVNTIAELERQGEINPSKGRWDNVFEEQLQKTLIPIVLTMPGTSARHKRKTEKKEINDLDREVIEFLGIHKAIGNGGVWIESDTLNDEIFKELYSLEEHCRGRNISNKYVWRSMKRMGRILERFIGNEQLISFKRASHITVFSDFPLGVAILPGYEEPLNCIIPISQRPLTPLTRALQTELPKVNEYYLGKGFKVLIIECLSQEDPIREFSEKGWEIIDQMFQTNDIVEIEYYEANEVSELKRILQHNDDADILIISAHGTYDTDNNFAGLVIGNETWLAYENDFSVPPFVILSACHVAPKGVGAVTVNDMFLRAGAKAVLGTLIPVNVMKNALITIRLFVQILEALNGSKRFRSLDEAWQYVVATNAINEILDSSKKLKNWAHKRIDGKKSPLEIFMQEKSKRLRLGNIHMDTINILRELAAEDGLQEMFDAIMNSQGYFPESCFYVLTGYPENIILKETIFDAFN